MNNVLENAKQENALENRRWKYIDWARYTAAERQFNKQAQLVGGLSKLFAESIKLLEVGPDKAVFRRVLTYQATDKLRLQLYKASDKLYLDWDLMDDLCVKLDCPHVETAEASPKDSIEDSAAIEFLNEGQSWKECYLCGSILPSTKKEQVK